MAVAFQPDPQCHELLMFVCLLGGESSEFCQESGSEGSHTVISPKVKLQPHPVYAGRHLHSKLEDLSKLCMI